MAGSIFCAVPVLPAALYPFSCAVLAGAKSTTPSIILRIWAEVISEITRCAPGGRGSGSSPSGWKLAGRRFGLPRIWSVLSSTMCGGR